MCCSDPFGGWKYRLSSNDEHINGAATYFTGLRPSEQIALLISDYDAVNGTLRVSKARVAGIDKNCTKTGEDRLATLCPRALRVLACHLRLRERLKVAGSINHDHLFFTAKGGVILHLQT